MLLWHRCGARAGYPGSPTQGKVQPSLGSGPSRSLLGCRPRERQPQPRVSRLLAGVGVRDRHLPVLQSRRGREARNLQDLLFVEGLLLQEGPSERIELLTVLSEETPGLVVALAYDSEHLGVHDAGGLLAEGLLSAVTARATKVRVLSRGELDRTELHAHSPAGDHRASEVGGLLDVVLGAGGP